MSHLLVKSVRRRVLVSILAVMPFGSCTTSPDVYYASQARCEVKEQDVDLGTSCFAIPQARDYLEQLQKQILDAWKLPRGVSADQRVTFTFRLRLDGSIQCLSLASDRNEAVSRSAVAAVQRGTPFSPVPPEAACLTELPVTATFSNPLEGQ